MCKNYLKKEKDNEWLKGELKRVCVVERESV
jgi:hypothetical protein